MPMDKNRKRNASIALKIVTNSLYSRLISPDALLSILSQFFLIISKSFLREKMKERFKRNNRINKLRMLHDDSDLELLTQLIWLFVFIFRLCSYSYI